MSRRLVPRPCKCGCGEFAGPNRSYVNGHNAHGQQQAAFAAQVRPAGMTLARALEIAIDVHDRQRGVARPTNGEAA